MAPGYTRSLATFSGPFSDGVGSSPERLGRLPRLLLPGSVSNQKPGLHERTNVPRSVRLSGMASYKFIKIPDAGEAISTVAPVIMTVPSEPIIPFIEGDGTGPDIWRATQRVLDAAVEKAYGSERAHRLDGSVRRREGA